MKRIGPEAAGSFFWLAVGTFFAIGGILLKPGALRNPGPGFLPLMMALLLICFSLIVLAKGLVNPGKLLDRIPWKKQGIMVISVLLDGVLLDFLGFLISTFLLMLVLFGLLFKGKYRWARVFFYAAGTALIGWLVFSVALHVPFPRARLMALMR